MKFSCLTLILCLGQIANATSYSGVINKMNSKVYLLFSNPATSLEVKVLTESAQDILSRLQSGDFLEGSGDVVSQSLVLDSIDFVSLAELLGSWESEDGWIEFKDFSNALLNLPIATDGSGKPVATQYSIVSGPNSTWKILFSSEEKVFAASLVLNGTDATFQFFDENGDSSQAFQLTKLNSPHATHHKSSF